MSSREGPEALPTSAAGSWLQEEFYGKEVIVADREMVEMVGDCFHVPSWPHIVACLVPAQRGRATVSLRHRRPSAHVQEADTILEGAKERDVSFLVVGDPFGCARLRPRAALHQSPPA